MADGMVPTWCVEEVYLQRLDEESESSSTRKSPASREPQTTVSSDDPVQQPEETRREEAGADDQDEAPPARNSERDERVRTLLPDNVEYLKERILELEYEKEVDRHRHTKFENKLWKEITVKNQQISSWDEVTQGITKGLATGQLTPQLSRGAPPENAEREAKPSDSSGKQRRFVEAEFVEGDEQSTERTKDFVNEPDGVNNQLSSRKGSGMQDHSDPTNTEVHDKQTEVTGDTSSPTEKKETPTSASAPVADEGTSIQQNQKRGSSEQLVGEIGCCFGD